MTGLGDWVDFLVSRFRGNDPGSQPGRGYRGLDSRMRGNDKTEIWNASPGCRSRESGNPVIE